MVYGPNFMAHLVPSKAIVSKSFDYKVYPKLQSKAFLTFWRLWEVGVWRSSEDQSCQEAVVEALTGRLGISEARSGVCSGSFVLSLKD